MKKISYSKASSYLDCPCKHYYRYIKGYRLKKPEKPLYFGSDFHKLLEVRVDGKEGIKKAFAEMKEKYYAMPAVYQAELGDDYLDNLKTIFNDYRKVWKGSEKPIETEHEFMIHIGNYKGEPVYVHGIIDEIYEDLIGGEHKTFSQAPSMGTLAMNMQTCIYSKAWELETGKKLQRIQWDYIKSSPASKPIWLPKSNRFSTANVQTITPYSWARACKERGIEDESILAQGELLYKQNISNFFFRCHTELLPVMVDTVWEDFKLLVKDIITREHKNKVKNIGQHCNWCSYRPICYAEFTGADVEYVVKTDYIVKEIEEDGDKESKSNN